MHNLGFKLWLLATACFVLPTGVDGQEKDQYISIAWQKQLIKPAFSASGSMVARPDWKNSADTTDPRAAAYEKALDNARALKKAGAFELASVEYDRAMRLNTKNTSEILKEKADLLSKAQSADTATSVEVEEVPLPGSPQWRYDSVVSMATRQFAGKRFDSAIINYNVAGKILPDQSFPASQVRAINWELEQIWKGYVTNRTEQLGKGVRAALAQKKYPEALTGLYELMHYKPRDEEWVRTQFANVERLLMNKGVDTEAMVAQVKLPDVWDVIQQKKPESFSDPAAAGSEKPGGVQSQPVPVAASRIRPAGMDAVQKMAIPYLPAQLAEMYPDTDFTQRPPDQAFNIIDDEDKHAIAIEKTLQLAPTLQLSNSTGNIKVSCERLYFNGLNTYMKIKIDNNSVSDFPVGPMLLSWKQRGRSLVARIPVAISDHPIVQSGKSFSLVYVCRSMYMRNDEELYFTVQGRLGFPKWKIAIPGKVYNGERDKSANYF
jgi:hypothetical protein